MTVLAPKISPELRAYLREVSARYQGGPRGSECWRCLEWATDLKAIDGVGYVCGRCRRDREGRA